MRTKRTRKWHKKISLTELKHLRENMSGEPSIERFKQMRKAQKEWDTEGVSIACHICNNIARKLGLE